MTLRSNYVIFKSRECYAFYIKTVVLTEDVCKCKFGSSGKE